MLFNVSRILDRELMIGVSYDFFVRAWYDDETYAVFRSDGVIPDVTPPKVITILGVKVRDFTAMVLNPIHN